MDGLAALAATVRFVSSASKSPSASAGMSDCFSKLQGGIRFTTKSKFVYHARNINAAHLVFTFLLGILGIPKCVKSIARMAHQINV